jgi:NADH:ubiquinone oxidoreductase subunit 2 (subunit N)
MAVNSVIALGYYLSIVRTMFMDEVPDGDHTPVKVPVPLGAVVAFAVTATIVVGVLPSIVSDIAAGASTALALGG